MNWPRAIIHVDMDTFFVSVERKSDPSLIGRPVIVGGGDGGETRRGIVAACSYETRVFGVHSAMPLGRALRLCPQAVVIPVGRSDYGAWSRRVQAVIEGFTDRFEMASLDEAYIDLEGTERLHGPPLAAADALRHRVIGAVGLPVSMGLATSKTAAKVASKLSKPQGLFVVFPGGEAGILRHMPLRALPGLGPKTERRLQSLGIHCLRDIIDLGEDGMRALLGDHGVWLHRRAAGGCRSRVEPSRDRRQISRETTFVEDVGDLEQLHSVLARMTMKIGAGLRQRRRRAGTLTLKVRHPDFTTMTRQAPLIPETHDDPALFKAAKALLSETWDGRTRLRLIGVGAANLTDAFQDDLFQTGLTERHDRLLATLDTVRADKGKDKLFWGSALVEKKKAKKQGAE